MKVIFFFGKLINSDLIYFLFIFFDLFSFVWSRIKDGLKIEGEKRADFKGGSTQNKTPATSNVGEL